MLHQPLIAVRFADLLDIGVIAVLLYLSLVWLRQRGARSLAVVLGALVVLQLTADRLNMVVTSTLFHLGFTAVLLALIVIFQHDIRRAFERLSAWRVKQEGHAIDGGAPEVDVLSECIAVLADKRIGALFVFRGSEPLEPHLRGGVAVDGRISLPLLYSIFHPASPGHDGAVVFDRQRIEKLGVHLPLSKNLAEIGPGGTRHAAAMGLSERCDASIVVVSEERGTITIAENGRLKQIQPAQLRPMLQRRHPHQSPATRHQYWSWLTRDVAGKASSLLLASILWLLLAYPVETVQRTYVVPIEYRNVPAGYVIDETGVRLAEITLSGTERTFSELDAQKLVVAADVDTATAGSARFVPTAGPDDLPSGLKATRVEPHQVPVILKRLTSNEAPQQGSEAK